jgi:hypothetical protein
MLSPMVRIRSADGAFSVVVIDARGNEADITPIVEAASWKAEPGKEPMACVRLWALAELEAPCVFTADESFVPAVLAQARCDGHPLPRLVDFSENDDRVRALTSCRLCGLKVLLCYAKRLDSEGREAWGKPGEWVVHRGSR